MAELTCTQRRTPPLKTWQMKKFQWTRSQRIPPFNYNPIILSGRVPVVAVVSQSRWFHRFRAHWRAERRANDAFSTGNTWGRQKSKQRPSAGVLPSRCLSLCCCDQLFLATWTEPCCYVASLITSLTEIFYQTILIRRRVLCFSVSKRSTVGTLK